ncbi:hypothetical protein TPHA_0B04190 [Tetrapisispora phaffii CBS 4417]|uniref:Diphthamide biosynthesis protein 4 n=1 Tax=Tetrapisispora phaffii (strain ATCC 24235 / CBS 4417 / NBRC 1672 / NRRL Y-8282 / UCD 70-5) TaxID=1071381 RepID=G8BQ08_TETPH|nr:hypothetical protein TPHA_0B04190 [Tetrapisispora phaffii CBS 4417]CCE62089.1 hypothetical protein TPHA_0B04190 [Tetrapisispora phaffii CBS 4417]
MTGYTLRVSHYEVLGVTTDSTLMDIKRAYKEKLLNVHPDKNKGQAPKSNTYSVNQIQEAYGVLAEQTLRTQYDASLELIQKANGFYNNGEGLDEYSLDGFRFNEETLLYSIDCPRCKTKDGMHISEKLLERHVDENDLSDDGYLVLIQCVSCSLWIKVNFEQGETDEE